MEPPQVLLDACLGRLGPPYQHGVALLAASMDGCVSLITYLEEEERWQAKTFFAHSNGVLGLAWRHVFSGLLAQEGGEMEFATAGADFIVRVWKGAAGEIVEAGKLERHRSWVRSVSWGEDLVSGAEDGAVVMWERGSEWEAKEIFNCKSPVWSICWNEYGGEIAVCSGDNFTRVFAKNEMEWKMVYEINENGQGSEHN